MVYIFKTWDSIFIMKADIGIIGGTGVYDPRLIEDARQVKVHTPYGSTSSPLTIGTYMGRQVAFISRHGDAHLCLQLRLPVPTGTMADS